VKEILLAMVARKPGHQGERGISRKTIARGMPGDSGVAVVTNARAFYTTRAAAGAPSARHSLRPPYEEGGTSEQNSGASRGENAELYLAVIASQRVARMRAR
jgi:hypothetical protein